VILHHHNLIGASGWKSLKEALNILNKLPFTDIQKHKKNLHTSSPQTSLIKRILNARKSWWPFGNKYFINIQNKKYPLYINKKEPIFNR